MAADIFRWKEKLNDGVIIIIIIAAPSVILVCYLLSSSAALLFESVRRVPIIIMISKRMQKWEIRREKEKPMASRV